MYEQMYRSSKHEQMIQEAAIAARRNEPMNMNYQHSLNIMEDPLLAIPSKVQASESKGCLRAPYFGRYNGMETKGVSSYHTENLSKDRIHI
ncbi:hypothetical protein GQ457_03G032480 [Hibiscus cannabinus]